MLLHALRSSATLSVQLCTLLALTAMTAAPPCLRLHCIFNVAFNLLLFLLRGFVFLAHLRLVYIVHGTSWSMPLCAHEPSATNVYTTRLRLSLLAVCSQVFDSHCLQYRSQISHCFDSHSLNTSADVDVSSSNLI